MRGSLCEKVVSLFCATAAQKFFTSLNLKNDSNSSLQWLWFSVKQLELKQTRNLLAMEKAHLVWGWKCASVAASRHPFGGELPLALVRVPRGVAKVHSDRKVTASTSSSLCADSFAYGTKKRGRGLTITVFRKFTISKTTTKQTTEV